MNLDILKNLSRRNLVIGGVVIAALAWFFFGGGCSEAEANESRVAAMGGDARLFLDDNTTMYTFPGLISQFPHVNVEDGGSATVLHGWGEGTVAGISMDSGNTNWIQTMYGTADYGVMLGTDLTSDGLDDGTSSSAFDVRYGRTFAGGDFGVGFNWGSTTVDTLETSAWGLDVDYRGQDGSLGMFNISPLLGLSLVTGENDSQTWAVDAGFGLNDTFAEGGRVVAGVFGSFVRATETVLEEDVSVTSYVIPRVTLGAEYDLFSWMTLRAGANRETSFNDGAIDHNFVQSYGVGFRHGALALDGVLSDGVLQSGPYMISGDSNDLFTQMSLTYNF